MATKAPTKISLFKQLSNYDSVSGISRIVCVDEFVGEYSGLVSSNGGGWCRLDGDFGRKYKVCIAKRSGELRFSWDLCDDERSQISQDVTEFGAGKFTKGSAIYLIKICGVSDRSSSRPIRQDIRAAIKDGPCVACGTTSQIEIDHKNGLYNDPRVLSAETQLITDFQPLCKHCNDQKRQTYNYTKTTGKRYAATCIPMLRPLGIDFVQGDETFDPNNVNATVGTYWHDPVYFMDEVSKRLKKKMILIEN
jgi:hypothetical protein